MSTEKQETKVATAAKSTHYMGHGWLSSQVVSVLDSGAEGPGFKSQLLRCRVTVLGKLFTPIVPLFTKQQTVTVGLVESKGSLPLGLCLMSPAG